MSTNQQKADSTAWWAVLVLFVAAACAVWSFQPPEPRPLDAPASEFSGLRAAETLSFLLGDETPHPVGSAANRAVRDRLISVLEELGLEPEIQRTVGCSQKFSLCANVENVLAEIPGETRDAVVVMAHYDSVPHAPGAADDGSGVVTMLESARVLLREDIRRNRILLVFTDAEEMGLLGAEGFFAEHRWVDDVKAVINIEGAGSGGPSLLLRSSNAGGHLLSAYRQTAENPQAVSYSQEVFARMPNDTDFTVPDRAGIASIDFAFAFEFNHYHTPLDTVANLDKGTLQHHGNNVLPLARVLADMDLDDRPPNFSYLTIAQTFWLTWPAGWTIGLAVLGLVALSGTGFRLYPVISVKATLGGFGLALAALSLSLLVCFGALWVADRMVGTTVNFPANPWPWRLLMFAGCLLPVSLLIRWPGNRLHFWARYLGVWWLLGGLALALSIAAPLAANLLIIPALVAGFCGLLAVVLTDASDLRAQRLSGLLATGALGYLLMSVSYAMEQTQGLNLAPAIYASVALIMLTFLPYGTGRRFSGAVALVLAVGWVWAAATPLYSEWRPQHVSLYYVLDRDQGSAQWSTIAANPLPEGLLDALDAEPEARPVAPWASGRTFPSVDAPVVAIPAPDVQVERDGSAVRVRFRSNDSGDFAQLILPADAGISDLTMAGHKVKASEFAGFVQARFFAPGNEVVEFGFNVTESGDFEGYLVDGSHTLPGVANPLIESRGKLAVPQHQGDQRIAFERIQF